MATPQGSTTIILTEEDKALIARINVALGVKTKIAAIRHALRYTVKKEKL